MKIPADPTNEIPNFDAPQYETLISALLKGTCIFIGAGISKLAGYKLWDELRHELVEYFEENKEKLPSNKRLDFSFRDSLKNHKNIIDSFYYLYSTDKNLFISGIKEIFYRDSKNTNNEIYYTLNKLNNGKNFFITTNIDKEFQKYLGASDEKVSIYPKFDNPPKFISYLHGRIDKEDTWIFTRAQYTKGYVINNAPCRKFLKYIYENYNILFIGYGLEEEEITRVISLTKKKKRKTHYWLEGSKRNNEDYLKIRSTSLKDNYDINLIPYYIDNEGYKLLLKVIDSLYKVMNEREKKKE